MTEERKVGFWADLLCGIGNFYWDLARILSAIAFLGVNLLTLYFIYKGQPPTLKEYADTHLALFAGCALFIAGKDIARHMSQKAVA